MHQHLQRLSDEHDAHVYKTSKSDARCEDFMVMRFEDNKTYQEIADMQEPPITRQAVYICMRKYLARNKHKLAVTTE